MGGSLAASLSLQNYLFVCEETIGRKMLADLLAKKSFDDSDSHEPSRGDSKKCFLHSIFKFLLCVGLSGDCRSIFAKVLDGFQMHERETAEKDLDRFKSFFSGDLFECDTHKNSSNAARLSKFLEDVFVRNRLQRPQFASLGDVCGPKKCIEGKYFFDEKIQNYLHTIEFCLEDMRKDGKMTEAQFERAGNDVEVLLKGILPVEDLDGRSLQLLLLLYSAFDSDAKKAVSFFTNPSLEEEKKSFRRIRAKSLDRRFSGSVAAVAEVIGSLEAPKVLHVLRHVVGLSIGTFVAALHGSLFFSSFNVQLAGECVKLWLESDDVVLGAVVVVALLRHATGFLLEGLGIVSERSLGFDCAALESFDWGGFSKEVKAMRDKYANADGRG